MKPKPIKFIDPKLITLLIIGLNLIFFLVYFFAFPDKPFWEKLWTYLGSAVFTLVTGSLIIPLLFSVLEKRYKFMENIEKEREEKKKSQEELKRASRRETIKETIEMWQELYGIVGDLIYYEPSGNDKSEINKIIIRLTKFPSYAEVTVNKWSHQFPNLPYKDHDVLLHFVNIIYQSGLTIALSIQRGIDDKQRRYLQDMLYLIQDVIKTIVHHRMIDVFKHSATLMELKEGGADREQIEKKEGEIKSLLFNLEDWANGLREKDMQFDNFLAPNEGSIIDDLRNLAREIEKWLIVDEKRQVFQSQQFGDFKKKFYMVSLEDRASAATIPYSIEYIRAIADWLSFEAACIYVYNRTHKIW